MTLHHFMREVDGRSARYHLRVEPDGAGLLLANASAAVKLSPSGVVIARALLAGVSAADTEKAVARAFRAAPRARVAEDVARVRRILDELVTSRSRYPVRAFEPGGASAFSRALSAPLGAEVDGGGGDNMAAILDALWRAGVPQVVFRVLDPEAGAQATRWVERAEDLGFIAGARALAGGLGQLDDLAQAGLDHVDVFFAGADAEQHDRVAGAGDFAAALALFDQARHLDVCAVAWIPIVADSLELLDGVAAAAQERGVECLTLVPLVAAGPGAGDGAIAARALRQAAALAEEVAEALDAAVTWAAPVEREPEIEFAEQLRAGPRSAGEAFIRVEADGRVMAPTGPRSAAGNLLAEPWEAIWGRDVFRAFREAVEDPPRCATCPGLSACAAGCPADPSTWARAGDRREPAPGDSRRGSGGETR